MTQYIRVLTDTVLMRCNGKGDIEELLGDIYELARIIHDCGGYPATDIDAIREELRDVLDEAGCGHERT